MLQRNQDAAFHADYRIHELQQALEDSEKTKLMLNNELKILIEEVSVIYMMFPFIFPFI